MIELIQGDCIASMEALLKEKRFVDLIVTSPPYNIGAKYPDYDDSISRKDYLIWTSRWLFAAKQILKDKGSLFLNIGGKPSDPVIPELVLYEALKVGWKLQNRINWIKSITVTTPEGEEMSVGHYKPINSKKYLNDCHEYIYELVKEDPALATDSEVVYHLTKEEVELDRKAIGTAYADKTNIKRFTATSEHGQDRADLRCRGNNWFIRYETRQEKLDYPCSFPEELPRRCIKLAGVKPGQIVLDPFSGSGTTMKVCQGMGLYGIGMELSPIGIELTKKRLEK